MKVFRVAHITDLHFGTRVDWLNPTDGSESARDVASRAYRFIVDSERVRSAANIFHPSGYNAHVAQNLAHSLEKRSTNLNAVLVTGDLATTGEQADLDIAANFLKGSSPLWWQAGDGSIPKLVGGRVPVISLPGNHDRYEGLLKSPGGETFEAVAGDFWDFDQQCMDSIASAKETGRVRFSLLNQGEFRLAIVCGDLSLTAKGEAYGLGGHLGQGRCNPQVVAEMASTTEKLFAEAAEDGVRCHAVWAVHFPPKSPLQKESLALVDDDLLIDAALDAGVSIVVSGHTHETRAYKAISSNTERGIFVICSGPSCGLSDHGDFGYSVLEFTLTAEAIACDPIYYRWHSKSFRFQPEDFPGMPIDHCARRYTGGTL